VVSRQSAVTAAAQAIDARVSAQDINYPKLQRRLQADQQVLAHVAAPASKKAK